MDDKKYVLPYLGDDIFTVIVGTGVTSKSFALHENLACARSKFFDALLSGNGKEFFGAPVELPDDNPDVFQVYTQSLYAGNMLQAVTDIPSTVCTSTGYQEGDRKLYRFLTDVYILSDKMIDDQAKDHAIKVIFELLLSKDNTISGEMVEMITAIWETTPVDAPIRRLLVDFVARSHLRVPMSVYNFGHLSDAPPAFLVSIIKGFTDLLGPVLDHTCLPTLKLDNYIKSGPSKPKQKQPEPKKKQPISKKKRAEPKKKRAEPKKQPRSTLNGFGEL